MDFPTPKSPKEKPGVTDHMCHCRGGPYLHAMSKLLLFSEKTHHDASAGIGALTALKLIQKHGNLAAVLETLDKTKYPLPDPFPYEIAQELFKGEPSISTGRNHDATPLKIKLLSMHR